MRNTNIEDMTLAIQVLITIMIPDHRAVHEVEAQLQVASMIHHMMEQTDMEIQVNQLNPGKGNRDKDEIADKVTVGLLINGGMTNTPWTVKILFHLLKQLRNMTIGIIQE
jgi:hypothetical protein